MSENLTLQDRIVIQTMKDNGHKAIEISNYLQRHKTTIYRELSKVTGPEGLYDAHAAHQLTSMNMVRTTTQGPSQETIEKIEEKILLEQWSPEQISGWLELGYEIKVSHTWIYQHVEKDRKAGGELANHMRRGKYSKGHKEYKGKIPDRVSIEARPAIVNQRTRLGDYEIDLIVGIKNQGAILSMIDRVSRRCILQKLKDKKAQTVSEAVISSLRKLDGAAFTITSDNGTEFTNHKIISETLGLDYYFAHPYASYERGSIENLNGLIRQYIPKGTDFSEVDDLSVKLIEDKLNSRPRKILGFLTPNQFITKHEQGELQLQI